MDLPHPGQYLLLDGAIATNLYTQGMPYDVCVEEYILNHPKQLQNLQRDFALAGSDILFAPTFGANRQRLSTFGLGDKVYEYNTRLVALCRQAAGNKLVAGALSSAGLQIEPYGETSFNEAIEIYEEQASALNAAGVDLFAIEAMVSLQEARSAVLACRKFNKPIFVTFTVSEHGKAISGASLLSCLVTLHELGIDAFGFNCGCDGCTELLTECIHQIAPIAKLPLIVKPNAGMPNPLLPDLYDLSPAMLCECMKKLLDCGACIIGGRCGTTPGHIKAMRKMLDDYHPPNDIIPPSQSNDLILANDMEAFALDNDRIEFTKPIKCEYDMADSLLAAESDSLDVLLIHIDSVEEAFDFAKNIHIANLPVCIFAANEEALDVALFSYQGRAMVDSQSPIEADVLEAISKKYGAVIY